MANNYQSQYTGSEIDQEIKYVKEVAHQKIDEFGDAISNKADDSEVVKYKEKNKANGYLGLNEEGKIDPSFFPVDLPSEEDLENIKDFNNALESKADKESVYTKEEVDEKVEKVHSGEGENSFIANDIENNKALSPNSTAMGGKTTAGGMGYKVIAIQDNGDGTGTYTLRTIEGLETGMSYSIRLKQEQQCNVGKITAIDTESRTVTVDNYYHMDLDGGADNPEKFTTEDYLTIVGRPDLGDVIVGFNALAAGENCTATDRDAVAFGRDVKVLGQYGFGAGRNNMVTYGATAIGMNCNALGLFSQAFGADLIATGYGQLVTGYNNIKDVDKRYLRIVGNGDNGESNAYTLDKDGIGWYAGGLKIGGNNQDDGEDVATEKYVEDYIEETLVNTTLKDIQTSITDIQTSITDIQTNMFPIQGNFEYKYISTKYNEEISETKIAFLETQGHFIESSQYIQVCHGYDIRHSIAPAAGTYTFSINSKSEGSGNGISIRLDGKEIFNTVLENTTEFADLNLGEITLDGKYHEIQIYATGSYAGIRYKYFELIPENSNPIPNGKTLATEDYVQKYIEETLLGGVW